MTKTKEQDKGKPISPFVLILALVLTILTIYCVYGLNKEFDEIECKETICMKYNLRDYEDCILIRSESGFLDRYSTDYYSCLIDGQRVEIQKRCVEYGEQIVIKNRMFCDNPK